MASLFVLVAPGSNVLAMDVSPGTRNNDGKVRRRRGSETSSFPAYLRLDAKNSSKWKS